MAICNVCGHFCPDHEGEHYCDNCLPAYLEKVEGLVQAARRLMDSQTPCRPQAANTSRTSGLVGVDVRSLNRIDTILSSLEVHHG